MASNTLAMDKEILEAMATKFSENVATSMLKKHRKFCMPHPLLKIVETVQLIVNVEPILTPKSTS